MNWKFILYIGIPALIIGLIIGYFGAKEYHGIENIQNKIDSLNIVEIEKEKAYQAILKIVDKRISNTEQRLKDRDEKFKNDTIVLSSDELIQRIRAINND